MKIEKLNPSELEFYRRLLADRVGQLSKPIADFDSVEWYWKDWPESSARMGHYSWLRNRVYLNKRAGNMLPVMLVATIVHELRHKYQHAIFRVFFFLLTVPLVRRFTIERAAKALEAEAGDIWN